MAVMHVTDSSFAQEVLQANQTVLVDFWAEWCGPCRMLAPALEELAAEHPEVKICKVNIDEDPDLALQYGVMSIPTLVVFRDGQVVRQSIGLQPKQALERLIV